MEEANILGLVYCLKELKRQKKNAQEEMARCIKFHSYKTASFYRQETEDLQKKIEEVCATLKKERGYIY